MLKTKVKTAEGPRTFRLPTEPTKPETELGRYSMLLYGLEKIGKTSLAAMFPDAFFLLCESGAKALSLFGEKVHTWREFLGWLDSLDAAPSRFKTVVVDTVDLAFKFCENAVCQRLGIEHPSEEEWGKGWGAVRNEFALAMLRLVNGPRGVVFISHATEKELKRKSGSSSHRIIPTMPGQARGVLEPMVDIWAYYQYNDDGGRILTMCGDDSIAAGHRCKDNFVGVQSIDMGKSAEEGYRNYLAAFGKTRGKSVGTKPATPGTSPEKGAPTNAAKRIVNIVRK